MNFEDRSSYDPCVDPVAAIVLTVECGPGQVEAIVDYLRGVKTQAGVYAAVVQVVGVTAPKQDTVEVEPVTEVQAEGEAHAEPEIQPAGGAGEADSASGSETSAVEPAADIDADEDSGVAEPAGEVGPGSLEHSGEAPVLPEERGAVTAP